MSARDTRQPLITAPVPARQSRWRWITPLLSLLALGGVGALGALAYEQAGQLRDADEQLQALDARVQGLDSTASERDASSKTQQDQLHSLQGSVDHLNAALGGDQRQRWQLAEVNYYVRMAQQHLTLTHDLAGSKRMLDVASRILADTSDNSLMALRQALSNDQLALKTSDKLDVAEAYLRLNALDQKLAALTVPAEAAGRHEVGAVQAAEAPTADSGWHARDLLAQGMAKFRGLITVRHYDEPIQPLLSDAQRGLVTENLRLHLGQAEMALSRGDKPVYEASLTTVQTDFAKYYQLLPAAEFSGIQTELAALAGLDVAPVEPPITAVAELDKLHSGADEPAAPAASSGVMP